MPRLLLVLAAALTFTTGCDSANGSGSRTETGQLRSGDTTLNSGEYVDEYEVDVRAGDRVSADLTSGDFDPYLILKDATGRQVDNDDCEGDRTRSCADFVASSEGTVRILVTSYEVGETGSYRLRIDSETVRSLSPTLPGGVLPAETAKSAR